MQVRIKYGLLLCLLCGSIKAQWERMPEDSIKIYMDSANTFLTSQTKEAIRIGNYVIKHIDPSQHNDRLHNIYYTLSFAYKTNGDIKTALDYANLYYKSLGHNADSCKQASVFSLYTQIYFATEQIDSILKYAQLVLEQNCMNANKTGRRTAYSALAKVFEVIGNLQAAEEYLLKGHAEYASNPKEELFLLIPLIQFYHDHNNPKYYKYAKRVIELGFFQNMNDEEMHNHYLFYFGLDKSPLEDKIQRLKRIIANAPNNMSRNLLYEVVNLLSDCYMQAGLYQSAIQVWDKLMDAGPDEISEPVLRTIYSKYAELYAKSHNYEKALYYTQEASVLKAKSINEESLERINELNIKYQTLQKDKEIDTQKSILAKQQLQKKYAYILAILTSIGIIILILYFMNKLKFQKAAQVQQDKLFSMELDRIENERFIKENQAVLAAQEIERIEVYEILNSSVGVKLDHILIGIKNDLHLFADEQQKNLHAILGYLETSKQSLKNIVMELDINSNVKIHDEIKNNCLTILHHAGLLYSTNFNFEIDSLTNFQKSELLRILQEILHNIVKHANAKLVKIDISDTVGQIILRVQDDGIGFDVTEKLKHGGIGLHSIQSRVQTLEGKLEIYSVPNEGTTVTVYLKKTQPAN